MSNAILTQNASAKTSKNYLFINTQEIVNKFLAIGYEIHKTTQARVNKPEKSGYQTHLVELINKNLYLEGEGYSRVLLRNNHYGEKSFQISVGFFRLVCSNGLVVGDSVFSAKIPHYKINETYLEDIVARAHQSAQDVLPLINKMRQKELTYNQVKSIHDFAMNIRGLKLVGDKIEEDQFVIESRLQANISATRAEDQAPTLWNVLNIIQEKVINGGLNSATKKGKFQKSRAIKSIDKNLFYNKQLFSFANTFLEAV